MQASRVVDQLEAFREEYPESPLVVFVPRQQIGRSIGTALARRRRGWRDLRTVIPRRYAEDVARVDIFSSERREAPVAAELFRAARIVQDRPEEDRGETLPGWHLLSDTVAKAFSTLREGSVGVPAVKERVQDASSSETLDLVAACYEDYAFELEEEGLYDDAMTYRWATERVRAGKAPGVPETAYAVAGATDLSERAFQFLKALRSKGRGFFRLGIGGGPEPPPETAAARFPEASVPEPPPPDEDPSPSDKTEGGSTAGRRTSRDASDRFVRAVGARCEVRAVFRDLLQGEASFGDATIAYADSRPYATLLADEADRMGIPLTMGTGLPASHTRTGRALRDLYEWAREDYDPEILVRMLRGGLLRTDRWLRRREEGSPEESVPEESGPEESGPEEGGPGESGREDGAEESEASPEHLSLRPHWAATLLAERPYEPGQEGLLSGLRAAIKELGGEVERSEKDESEGEDREGLTSKGLTSEGPPSEGPPAKELTSREEDRLARLRLLREYVRALTDLIPARGDVGTMARKSRTFLQRFGPTDAPTKPEEERTPDEAARGLLYKRLSRLTGIDVSLRARGPQLAALFQQWLSGQYVQAESPRPGHVHVLPLESAGYSDRSRLHVVGLDATTFSATSPGEGLIREPDRRALVSSLEEPGEDSRANARPDETLWRAGKALKRHRGPVAYYTRIFDIEAGEERDPSSLFLQAERASGPVDLPEADGEPKPSGEEPGSRPEKARPEGNQVARLVPSATDISLSEGEEWLRARQEGRKGVPSNPDSAGDEKTARGLLGEKYPWVLRGEAARQARASGEYTAHDGLLPAGSYPDLSLFDSDGRPGDERSGDGRPVSASRLETLAEAPYIYFLKYVLGVRPLEEPALDDEPWLNRLRKGTLLHSIYEEFMLELGRAPREEDAPLLEDTVDEVLEEETETFAPPSPVVEQAARRELLQNARVFFRAEVQRASDYAPEHFEVGFGGPPRRREPQDLEEPARLSVGENALLLRGRVDRVDQRRETGALAAWDYKTGEASSYDDEEPLQGGKTLQWALYAYALESLLGETVGESGYFFANAKEMGRRISADPDRYRADVEQVLQRLGALTESGTFPVTPDLKDVNDWKWAGYDRLVLDLRKRKKELQEKSYPEGRPRPPSF